MGLNVTTVDHYFMLLRLSQSWFKFWNNMPSKATDPVFNAPEYFPIHQDIDWDDYQSRDMLSLHQQSIPYKCHSLILYSYFLTSCNHLQSDQETLTSLGCRLIQQICTAVFKKFISLYCADLKFLLGDSRNHHDIIVWLKHLHINNDVFWGFFVCFFAERVRVNNPRFS